MILYKKIVIHGGDYMNKKEIVKIVKGLFIVYCLVLIYVLFMHNNYRYGMNFRLYNLIPFKTIIGYFERLSEHTINTSIVIQNLSVNLILFLPMGMALPVIFENKIDKFWKLLIISLIVIILSEIIQFITMIGSADIDDIILNTIGACIGYFIVHLEFVRKILKLDE